jgi:hypothetical protein
MFENESEIKDWYSAISKCIKLRKFDIRIHCENEKLFTSEMANLRECMKSLSQLEIFRGYMTSDDIRDREFDAEWLSEAFRVCLIHFHIITGCS